MKKSNEAKRSLNFPDKFHTLECVQSLIQVLLRYHFIFCSIHTRWTTRIKWCLNGTWIGIWTQPWENFNDETKSWEWSVRKINKYKSGSATIPEEDRWRSHSWVIEANSRKSHEDSVSSRSSRLTSRAQNGRCKIEASHLTESVLSHSLLPAPPRGPASCQARQGQNSLRAALFSDSTDSSRFGVIEA